MREIFEKVVGLFASALDDMFAMLVSALKHSEDTTLVIGAMGASQNREAISPLILLIEDPSSFVRCETSRALGEIGREKALPALCTLVQDSCSNVRSRAV